MGISAWRVRTEIVDAYKPYVELSWAVDKDANYAALTSEHEGLADLVSWLMGGKARITSDEFVTNLKCGIKEAGDDFNSEDKQMLKLYGKLFACSNGSLGPSDVLLAYIHLHLTSFGTQCDACKASLGPLYDMGYQCLQCGPLGTPEDNARFDLCSSCFSVKPAATCPRHPDSAIISRSQDSLPVAFVAREGHEPGRPGPPAYSVPCICCHERHTIVLSYLRPDVYNLHMRPVLRPDKRTGKQSLAGFVCEFCAVRVCSKHTSSCMWWDTNNATPGLCMKLQRCDKSKALLGCPGLGDNPGFSVLESKARARTAAHYPTCAAKLEGRVSLWQPAPAGWSNPACSSSSSRPHSKPQSYWQAASAVAAAVAAAAAAAPSGPPAGVTQGIDFGSSMANAVVAGAGKAVGKYMAKAAFNALTGGN